MANSLGHSGSYSARTLTLCLSPSMGRDSTFLEQGRQPVGSDWVTVGVRDLATGRNLRAEAVELLCGHFAELLLPTPSCH
jgi:hypothetical protein